MHLADAHPHALAQRVGARLGAGPRQLQLHPLLEQEHVETGPALVEVALDLGGVGVGQLVVDEECQAVQHLRTVGLVLFPAAHDDAPTRIPRSRA